MVNLPPSILIFVSLLVIFLIVAIVSWAHKISREFKQPLKYSLEVSNTGAFKIIMKNLPKISMSEREFLLTSIFGCSVCVSKSFNLDGTSEILGIIPNDAVDDLGFLEQLHDLKKNKYTGVG